jgi:hypothetical protein
VRIVARELAGLERASVGLGLDGILAPALRVLIRGGAQEQEISDQSRAAAKHGVSRAAGAVELLMLILVLLSA